MAEEILVEIEAPAPPPPIPGTEADKPDAAVEDLRQQLETITAREAEQKTAREQAERRARESEAEAVRLRESETKARGETVDSQLDAVANAENAAKAESDTAENEYAAAMEAGDYKKAGAAQRRMSNAEARLIALGQSKADLEAAKRAPPRAEPKPQQVDPLEKFISERSAPTQSWLRQHMEVLTDPQLSAIANGADAEARRLKLKPDSPEYFALIETRLGYRQEETVVVDPNPEPAPKPSQRRPLASAPVAREANGSNGASTKVKLTRDEADRAMDGTHVWDRYDKEVMDGKVRAGTPIGIQEMAKRKQIMLANGDYSRKTEDE